MKYSILIFTFALLTKITFSQNQNNCSLKFDKDTIHLYSKEDIVRHKALLLQCVDCFLNIHKSWSLDKSKSFSLISKYNASRERTSPDILPYRCFSATSETRFIFMAIDMKYQLDNIDVGYSEEDRFIETTKLFIDYCENPQNIVKRFNKEMLKAQKYKNENKLDLYYKEVRDDILKKRK